MNYGSFKPRDVIKCKTLSHFQWSARPVILYELVLKQQSQKNVKLFAPSRFISGRLSLNSSSCLCICRLVCSKYACVCVHACVHVYVCVLKHGDCAHDLYFNDWWQLNLHCAPFTQCTQVPRKPNGIVITCVVYYGRPDMTSAVDWALKGNYNNNNE